MVSKKKDDAPRQPTRRASTRRMTAAISNSRSSIPVVSNQKVEPTRRASTRRMTAATSNSCLPIPMVSNQEDEPTRRASTRRMTSTAPNFANFRSPAQKMLEGLPVYFIFESGFGYALFRCDDADGVGLDFISTEEYIKDYKRVFKLIATYPFQSTDAALVQLTTLYNGKPTEELIEFLLNNLPQFDRRGPAKFYISSTGAVLTAEIAYRTLISSECGFRFASVIRGLRANICEFLEREPADLEKIQQELALKFARQTCKGEKAARFEKFRRDMALKFTGQTCEENGNSMAANSSSSSSSSCFFDDEVVVVPHEFEGVFIAKGKKNEAICTKNLLPGEAVNGEELISVKNKDGSETEYRVWNRSKSMLSVAIQSGIKNMSVKPGSRILCMGNDCGITVSHISDIVGLGGLVYTVSVSSDVVKMAEKRSNVIGIYEHYGDPVKYRMIVGMVDAIICVDLDCPNAENALNTNAMHYLRAGGQFFIVTKADGVTEDGTMFRDTIMKTLFGINITQTIKLENDFVLVSGCYRNY